MKKKYKPQPEKFFVKISVDNSVENKDIVEVTKIVKFLCDPYTNIEDLNIEDINISTVEIAIGIVEKEINKILKERSDEREFFYFRIWYNEVKRTLENERHNRNWVMKSNRKNFN